LAGEQLGLGGTVELIRTMVDQKENPIPSPTEVDPTQA
ncbi:MAG: cytidylate kinase-like family protein, partial [Clostridiales bacterium]|nr:cytidylate kinase-like family protein [Clostridiales bacterium]